MEFSTPASRSTHLTRWKEKCTDLSTIGQSHRFTTCSANSLRANTGSLERRSHFNQERRLADLSDRRKVSALVELDPQPTKTDRHSRLVANTCYLGTVIPEKNSIIQRAENAIDALVRVIARQAAAEFFGSKCHGAEAGEVAA